VAASMPAMRVAAAANIIHASCQRTAGTLAPSSQTGPPANGTLPP